MVVSYMGASPTVTASGPMCKFHHFEALLSPMSATLHMTAGPGRRPLSLCHDLWLQCSSVTGYGTVPRDGVVITTLD